MHKAILCFLVVTVLALSSLAQDGAHNMDMSGQSQSGSTMPDMEDAGASHALAEILPSPHAGSGTGWQPASVPARLWMTSRGGWDLMAHCALFLTYNQQGGPRGEGKAESVNYLMLMEQHRLGTGTILFREMLSAESLTSPHPGFPLLFQTGETYHNQPLVDHQHPHNVFAELSMLYTVPVSEKVSWLFYGGPAAEPALGPVTYIHRESAAEDPAAPLSHHLQDSTQYQRNGGDDEERRQQLSSDRPTGFHSPSLLAVTQFDRRGAAVFQCPRFVTGPVVIALGAIRTREAAAAFGPKCPCGFQGIESLKPTINCDFP